MSRTYLLHAIENGENFGVIINSSRTGEELKQVARDMVAGWSGELINMEEQEFNPTAWDCDKSDEENMKGFKP